MTDGARTPRRRPSLLDRLDSADKRVGSDRSDEGEIAAIVRNLDAVLNTKAGYGSTNAVFGLADTSGYLSSRDALEVIVAGMLENVTRFEPRVELPVIRLVGHAHGLWARFELTGRVSGQRRKFGIRFHAVFRSVQVQHV